MASPGLDGRRRWVLSVLEEYEVPLTRFATRMLHDEHAARDVVQHAFLRLCGRSAEELHDRVAPWLFTVCRNKAVDVLRGRRRTASLEQMETPDCVGPEPDPAEAVEMRELHRRLSGLIDGLPSSQRETLGLWSEGFSHREIAQITERSEGSVRVLVHRALKQLRGHPVVRELFGRPAQPSRLADRETSEFV